MTKETDDDAIVSRLVKDKQERITRLQHLNYAFYALMECSRELFEYRRKGGESEEQIAEAQKHILEATRAIRKTNEYVKDMELYQRMRGW